MSKISILIPVYNESAYIMRSLENVVNENLESWEKEIIVVDDGSTDNTLHQLKEFQKKFYPIKILKNSQNKGKGAAVKLAAKEATGDILIIQDADLEYDPSDYTSILEAYADPQVSVVYGSRILGAKIFTNFNSNKLFYFGGIFLTYCVNKLMGVHLTDQPTGYKSWRSELTESLLDECPSDGFEFEIEMTAHFSKKNGIVEVPIHYYPRSTHHGKKIGLKDFFLSLFVAFRHRSKLR